MTPEEYSKWVWSLASEESRESDKSQLLTTVLGLNGEAGEFADHIKHWLYQGHKLDDDYMIKELGDVLWYVAFGSMALGLTLQDIMDANVTKLTGRYPEGSFSVGRSVNREEGNPDS